jgi:hypothetical protein
VKEYLGIPSGTATEDSAIDAALAAAEDEVDNICGRTFVVPGSATAKVFEPTNGVVVEVDDIAQTTGLVVKTDTADDGAYDKTLTLTSEYILEGNAAPYRIIRRVDGSTFPRYMSDRPTIEVTAYWGYAMAVPGPIVQAATVLSARLYQRRSSPLGFQAGMSTEFGPVRISRIDPDIRTLLYGYRRIGVA